jgi:hypothetical protein
VRLGSQAFSGASTFNANIGAWNTASVSNMASVCAAFLPAARHRRRPGRTRSGFDAARPVVRCATADAHECVCAHTYRHSLARASTGVCIAARRNDGRYLYIYTSHMISRA